MSFRIGDIVKNAPNALIWAVSICFIAILAAFTVLAATGADTTDLRTFLNTVLNIASALLSGGAVVVAGAAAKSAGNAERQTNGLADAERSDIARRAAREAIAGLASDKPVE